RPQDAAKTAYASMVRAAQGLVKAQNPGVSEDENQILAEFTSRFYETQLFWDKYAGGKFDEYMFKAKEFLGTGNAFDADRALQLVQESQLFIDAAHDCHNKLNGVVANAAKLDIVQATAYVADKWSCKNSTKRYWTNRQTKFR